MKAKDNHSKTILLPLDGSKTSLTALLPAQSLAILLNLTVRVLYISDEKLSKEELIKKLGFSKDTFSRCIIDHKSGNARDIIINESKLASYIVMSTHGETADMTKLAGSTSVSVIENSDIPVLLVRPDVTLTLEENLWKPKKALIPLNGTPSAAKSLVPAIDILAKTNAELDLLHISSAHTSPPKEKGSITAPYYEDYPQYEWPSWSREFLKRFCPLLQDNNVNIKLSLSKGDPAEEILSFSRENKNDFIAMAWHGQLGALHAKVLKKVIFDAPCPILLIKIEL